MIPANFERSQLILRYTVRWFRYQVMTRPRLGAATLGGIAPVPGGTAGAQGQ